MDSELIFALVRAAKLLEAEADSWGNAAGHPERAQATLIRAHIDRERAGGERAQIVALEAERDKLASIVRGWHWLAVGPDEMGDYLHQRELIKASEPYADPALKALAKP